MHFLEKLCIEKGGILIFKRAFRHSASFPRYVT